MPRYSEKTFGERYSKGRGLVEYLKLIPTYSPGNITLQPANLDALLDTINTATIVRRLSFRYFKLLAQKEKICITVMLV